MRGGGGGGGGGVNKVSDFMSICWKYSIAVTPSHLKPC